MSKKCLFCGTNLEDDDLFCDECGKKQEVNENVASVPKLVQTEEVSFDNEENDDISAISSLEMKQYQEEVEAQRLQLISERTTSYNKMVELSEWYKMMMSRFDSPSICLHCGKKHLFDVKICKECGTVCENGIDSNGKKYRQCWLSDKRTSYYLLQDNYFSYNVADADGGLTIRRFRINQNDHRKVDFIEFSCKNGRRISDESGLQSIDIQNNEFDGFYCVIPKDNLGLTRTLSPDGKAAFWNMVDSKPIGTIQTVFPGGTFKLEGGNDLVIKKKQII